LLDNISENQRFWKNQKLTYTFEAKNLAKCLLSEALEERIGRKLNHDIINKAFKFGNSMNTLTLTQNIVIRVVNSTAQTYNVKNTFLKYFKQGNYPSDLKYTQKVIMLFQKTNAVDVMLFCMYVQEYEDENKSPNNRTCYLSYLDSINYFRPEMESAESCLQLRSMIYHETLIGYFDFAKNCGFNQILVWACPCLQGDDYIFYCHPKRQKNPMSDILREWYFQIIIKAQSEGVVYSSSNFYDKYFIEGKDFRMLNTSMMDLPNCEGDYWPAEAENLLSNFKNKIKQTKKKSLRTTKKSPSSVKKTLADIDCELMTKLAKTIEKQKKDYILVYFNPQCSFCRKFHENGLDVKKYNSPVWFLPGTMMESTIHERREPFTLCDKCYRYEHQRCKLKPYRKYRYDGQKQFPHKMNLSDMVPRGFIKMLNIKDSVKKLDTEIFQNRSDFLSLCQGNRYQFDSIRRAKHSTMMVLYHLHHPEEPAFVSTCNICSKEIDVSYEWRCHICEDYDLCTECYRKNYHEHTMLQTKSRSQDSKIDRNKRIHKVNRWVKLFSHSSLCIRKECNSFSCREFRKVLKHMRKCNKRNVSIACHLCTRLTKLILTYEMLETQYQ
jgi:E1A/CREB-binding protein